MQTVDLNMEERRVVVYNVLASDRNCFYMSHIIVSLILQLTQNFVFHKIPSKTVLSDHWLVVYLFRFKHGICIMFCTRCVTGQVFRDVSALILLSDIFFYKYHYAKLYLRLAESHATVYLSLFSRRSESDPLTSI
jgi:hypothetical protein